MRGREHELRKQKARVIVGNILVTYKNAWVPAATLEHYVQSLHKGLRFIICSLPASEVTASFAWLATRSPPTPLPRCPYSKAKVVLQFEVFKPFIANCSRLSHGQCSDTTDSSTQP